MGVKRRMRRSVATITMAMFTLASRLARSLLSCASSSLRFWSSSLTVFSSSLVDWSSSLAVSSSSLVLCSSSLLETDLLVGRLQLLVGGLLLLDHRLEVFAGRASSCSQQLADLRISRPSAAPGFRACDARAVFGSRGASSKRIRKCVVCRHAGKRDDLQVDPADPRRCA